MNNFERGWMLYEEGKKMIREAKGWPIQVKRKIKEGTKLIIEGAKLAYKEG